MSLPSLRTLEERVTEMIAAELRVERARVLPDTHFSRDLGGDSLDALNVALQLERAFGVKIPDEALQRFQTVRDIVRALEQRLREGRFDVPSASDYASGFLAGWSLRLDDIAGHIRPLQADDVLLLVGSIPEGLANPLSDLDLLLVSPHSYEDGLVVDESEYAEAVARLPPGQELNVEHWKTADVESIGAKLGFMLDLIRDPSRLTRLARLNDSELRLLHRLRVGIPLSPAARVAELRARLRVDELPDYLVLHWIAIHYVYREDAIAQVRYGDPYSTVTMLRLALDCLAGAMLASVGETHPYPKWRASLLRRHAEILGQARVDELLAALYDSRLDDTQAQVERMLALSDLGLSEALGRREHLLPAMAELDMRVTFIKHLDELSAGSPGAAPQ